MPRINNRPENQPRPCTIQPNFVETADGSCLISTGKTRVICTASVEEGVPPFLREAFKGFIVIAAVLLQKKEDIRLSMWHRSGWKLQSLWILL